MLDLAWAVTVTVGAACLLLGYAGVRHACAPAGLLTALTVHRVLPRRLVSATSVAGWGWLEAGCGAAGLVSLMGGRGDAARIAPAACAALLLGYAGYLAVVRRRRGVVPCGCLGAEGRTTHAAVARAALLGLTCAAHAARPSLPEHQPATALGVLAAAVLVLALVVTGERFGAVLRAPRLAGD